MNSYMRAKRNKAARFNENERQVAKLFDDDLLDETLFEIENFEHFDRTALDIRYFD